MKITIRKAILAVVTHGVMLGTVSASDLNPERRGIGTDPQFNSATPGLEAAGKKLDPLRSLVVTTVSSVAEISFGDVMNRLAKADDNLTGDMLFRRWWDTNNTTADAEFPDDSWHCDGSKTPANGFAYACPRPEGQEARLGTGTGTPDDYLAIGVTNRLDLAPADGANCGEQRLVFAKRAGETERTNRNLLIFEAHMPNPDPGAGVFGCRPIAEFWASLSSETFIDDSGATQPLTPQKRGQMLRDFFFNGIPHQSVVAPVAAARYGANAEKAGQIRTNQFAIALVPGADFVWTLREYKTAQVGTALRIIPTTVKATPATELFKAGAGHANAAQAEEIGNDVITQLEKLSGIDLDTVSFGTSNDTLNMGESDESNKKLGDVITGFAASPANGVVRSKLAAATIPNSLTPDDVVSRVGAMTCAGCHQHASGKPMGGGQDWPNKQFPFVHISEQTNQQMPSPNGDGLRFGISTAMHDPDSPSAGFLNARMNAMNRVLAGPAL